jgi:hypothetical protein
MSIRNDDGSMNFGAFSISHIPGSTYNSHDTRENSYDDEPRPSKAELRQHAIAEFRKAAQATTRGQIHGAVEAVMALTIQLRAMGGTAVDTDLGSKMREAADFLEDL